MKRIVLYSIVLFLWHGGSVFGEQKHLGEFGDWDAWLDVTPKNRLCYIATTPTKSEGKYAQRGKIYLLVAKWPRENARNEVSFTSGYEFEQDGTPTLSVDDTETYYLFSQGEWAWTQNSSKDEAVIKSFVKGKRAIIRGVSWRETETKDTFSLSGFTAAWAEVNRNCP